MDGLSAVSGSFAVVSLAVQIGSSIKKLCDFWEAMQESPNDVRIIVNDLNVISSIIADIHDEASTARPQTRALSSSHAALDACASSTEMLEAMLSGHQPGLDSAKRSKRTWAAAKVAWNGDKMKKYLDILGQMKMSLLLARQNAIE